MLMKHKPSQCLAMPHALLEKAYCACVCVCSPYTWRMTRVPWHGCAELFLTVMMPGAFYTWHWPEPEGRSNGVAGFILSEEKVCGEKMKGMECRQREGLGGAATRERERVLGREAETEGQVWVIFGRKRPSFRSLWDQLCVCVPMLLRLVEERLATHPIKHANSL